MNTVDTASPPDSDAILRSRIAINLRALRQIKHLTQAELARRVGMRPGPMNAIEQGRHVPSGRVLLKLADELGASVDAILGRTVPSATPGEGAEAGGVPYVAEAAVGYGSEVGVASEWPRATAIPLADDSPVDAGTRRGLDQVVQVYLALEDFCGAQKRAHLPLFLPFAPTDAGIEALTQQVRQMLGIGQAVIFDYLELLENAGLRVVFYPLPQRLQSAAFYDACNANAFLIVNDTMNVERQLFEVIKRLGSVFGHTRKVYGGGKALVVTGALDEAHAARKFAALFLMPSSAVRATVAQLGLGPGDWTYDLLLRIKHRFGVSAQAFLFRLNELGLVTEAMAAGLRDRIERHYRATGYVEPDSTRRVLSPNGRLGDLVLAAWRKPETRAETLDLDMRLRRLKLKGLHAATLREVRG